MTTPVGKPQGSAAQVPTSLAQALDQFGSMARSVVGDALGVPIEVIALGWGTVDLERAAGDLRRTLGPDLAVTPTEDAILEPHLGARGHTIGTVGADGTRLVVLEPSTEGRLAYSLARSDEGPIAAWLAVRPGVTIPARTATSSERLGPFGPERLLLGGPLHGPHHLVVLRPGTIRP